MTKKPTIVIDCGHGDKHPGAVAGGIREADVNLSVGLLLGGMLYNAGWDVRFTRSADVTIGLYERVEIEHRVKPDVFISLHCNSTGSPGVTGLEVFTTPGQTAADPLATCLLDSLGHTYPDSKFRTDFSDGDPDKEANFYVLKHTHAPANLVEMAFLSNDKEREWICDLFTQFKIAQALMKGTVTWYEGRSSR